MSDVSVIEAADNDDGADRTIRECVNPDIPRSFFLYAGAGTGKTRSLVSAMNHIRAVHGRRLWLRGQRVGVITYTNAACDEIRSRLAFDKLFDVSTIHSFAWTLIGGYNADIREWLRQNLQHEVAELRALQARGRPNSQASIDRARSIDSKINRLSSLDQVKKFVYSPTGDNRGKDSLNHSEVIEMTVSFLMNKQGLQNVLVGKFPILLIDESQDTNRYLMDAFLKIQSIHEARFCLGLFGDTMQRIYADGKVGLGENLPPSWAQPSKHVNYRCPRRVITLINKIRSTSRSTADRQQQTGPNHNIEGSVRLFVIPTTNTDKFRAEATVASRMAEVTGNPAWTSGGNAVKTLILEHHMAARRLGFLDMFEALYPVESIRTGLLDGSLSGLSLFSNQILPLIKAMRKDDAFAAAATVRKHSPLLDKATLKAAGTEQPELLKQVHEGAKAVAGLWEAGRSPRFGEVLRCVSQFGLFDVPEPLRTIAARRANDFVGSQGNEIVEDDTDVLMNAWARFIDVPFEQIEGYSQYVKGQAAFDTHQGVKGREFPLVMVIIDDEEARGFMFDYDKLFGVKEKTKTDRDHERKGEETIIDRTRRLFYVTCSRTAESLAIVAYSSNPQAVRASALAEGWFNPDEIELLAA